MLFRKHIFTFLVLGAILITIPVAVLVLQQEQTTHQHAATPTNGLTVTSQIQSGIGGGFPNNQTETDISWIDPTTNNGWRVGYMPSYGGAILSPWYEITNGMPSNIQTNLNETIPGNLYHVATDKGGTILGTQSSSYTIFDLPPLNSPFRRSYSARIPSNNDDSNGFNYHITTTMYPGDPGLFIQRTDITNATNTDIPLGAADAITVVPIGGLQQEGQNVWVPNNGGYGIIGDTTVVGWPASLISKDPDYVYITPNPGSGIATGVLAVNKTHLSDLGAINIQMQYQQDTHKLQLTLQGFIDHFPANSSESIYSLEVLKRNLNQTDAVSLARDYLNPDSPTMLAGDFMQFSYDDGAYQMNASNNAVVFAPTFPANISTRWLTIYEVFNYSASNDPIVKLDGTLLTPGVDYIADVDTNNQIAYVKLMKPIVASNASANQLHTGTFEISDGTSQIITNTPIPSPTISPTPTLTPSPTPSPSLSPTPSVSPTPSPSPSPTPSPSPSPTPTPLSTTFDVTICPHGIGNCGDNANPIGTGNINPVHTVRTISLTLLGTNGLQVTTTNGSVLYNTATRNFQGAIAVPGISSGQYIVRLKMNNYLSNLVPGITTVTQGSSVILSSVPVTAGDIVEDNQLDIKDYNNILSCFGSLQQTSSCTTPIASDVNDDGKVDPIDYNLFLRELSVQQGK